MTTPGSISGTFAFALSNAQIVIEAFDRIGFEPAKLTRHHMTSAWNSLNLELSSWDLKGFSLWKLTSGTINLVAGQGSQTSPYALPANLVTLTDVWYTTVDITGGGVNNTDRLMTPLTREQYAAISNKNTLGTPMQYWFQRLATPQLVLWQVPSAGAPNYVINWFGLQQIQDAGIGSGETPDVLLRGLDALIAGLTRRLAEKFAPARLKEKAELANEAWAIFATDDQEAGPLVVRPNLGDYGRI